ncbi:hypothetical protein K7X08_033431 [Anisodus acutangulus]|uniref:Uncharacterized protein n=1 Tax=Anisodus acutangulus TaxID=402998 RepID=A0A9Q1M6L8_9SOLA|nr:hypothetical protein K7X08_033431 [Anisodus acutangulus]
MGEWVAKHLQQLELWNDGVLRVEGGPAKDKGSETLLSYKNWSNEGENYNLCWFLWPYRRLIKAFLNSGAKAVIFRIK